MDLDIGSTVMDFHTPAIVGEGTPEEELGFEYARMSQALLAAGIDIKSLTPMDRSRVMAALWCDNSLFEEAGAMLMMYRQSYGLLDAMHHTEEEIEDELQTKKARIAHEIEEAEDALNKIKAISLAGGVDLDAFQFDWNTVSKNMTMLFFAMDEMVMNKAPQAEIDAEIAHFYEMTPMAAELLGQADPQYYLGRQHLIETSRIERLVGSDIKDSLASILQGFEKSAAGMEMPQIGTHFAPPAGKDSWVGYVEGRRNEGGLAVPEAVTAQVQDGSWQGKIISEELLAELMPKEAQVN